MSRSYKSSSSGSGGMGLLGVLQVIFIVLKLCKVLTWSWWQVFIPTWINLGIIVIALIFIAWLKKK